MRLSPRLPAANVNVSRANPLRDFASMLGTLVLLAVAVYAALGLAVDLLVPRLTPAMERRIVRAMVSGHPLLKNSRPAPEALQALADRTRLALGEADGELHLRVVDAEAVNAFALPGRTIVLTSGMLRTLEYENELVFVLGHELGHIAARDHLRALGRGLVLVAMTETVLGDRGGLSDLLSSLMLLTDRGFSRAQESRADRSGLRAMHAVYGHVGGLDQVFAHLGDTDYDALTEFTLTHPESSKRVAALRGIVSDEGYAEAAPLPLGPDLR